MSIVIDVTPNGFASDFPNGWYEATIKKVESKVAVSSGNPYLAIELELFSPIHGTGSITDRLPTVNGGFKARPFWKALNDMDENDLAQINQVDAGSPADWVNAQVLVCLGEKPGTDKNGVERMYKQLVHPFYAPLSRAGELLTDEDMPL